MRTELYFTRTCLYFLFQLIQHLFLRVIINEQKLLFPRALFSLPLMFSRTLITIVSVLQNKQFIVLRWASKYQSTYKICSYKMILHHNHENLALYLMS